MLRCIALSLALLSCKGPAAAGEATEKKAADASKGDADGGDAGAVKAPDWLIVPSPRMLATHIEALSTDGFGGRRPGTEGGRKAVMYIAGQMQTLHVEPAGEQEYRQGVAMRGVSPKDGGRFRIDTGDADEGLRLELPKDLVVGSYRDAGAQVVAAELVFAGYGVTAPEYDWDDYAGVDVTDKVVVVFVGDPPVTDGRFGGDALTYYGRWSYKFERALKAGAAACLVIHEAAPASYGYQVVEASWSGERFGLLEKDGSVPPALSMQGWLHRDAAESIAKAAGASLEQWHTQAMEKGFVAKPLGMTFDGRLATRERRLVDYNVVGKIPGRTKPEESVVLTAHWDHLGTGELGEGEEDAIFNGAVDNASGIAGMLAVAAGIQTRVEAGEGPQRSIVFVATTAEEQGLLGSKHYAAHPTVPRDGIVAVANLDSMNVHGRTKTITVVGAGQSTLEDILAEIAAGQGRTIVPDERPEAGGYYRSDHFSFAKLGIPAIYFRGGLDLEEGGEAAGRELARERSKRYHTPADEFDPTWPLTGAMQDVEAMTELLMRVANGASRPKWKPSSEFAPRP